MSDLEDRLCTKLEKARARIKELEDAIEYHYSQRGDDRCWIDDMALYTLIGKTDHPGLKLPKEEFLGNCARYWQCQQEGSEYRPQCDIMV